MALLYPDEDNVPELLTLQNGGYRLYIFDGSQVTAIAMPDAEIKASAYARRHEVGDYPEDSQTVTLDKGKYVGSGSEYKDT